MQFNARGGISILELAIYTPSLLLAGYICQRHGFSRSSGWIFTLILCLIRIIGACCQLATYSHQSTGLIEAAIILDSIGVSPLLLATLGLTSRYVDSVRNPSILHPLYFRLTQLTILIGLIMSIVGGTSSTSSTGVHTPQTTSKAGIGLYCAAFAALVLISLYTSTQLSRADAGEKRLLLAVLLAFPFILVRIVYSACSVFGAHGDFNLLTGSVVIYAIMAVLMEFIVIGIYLVVGLKVQVLAADARGPIASRGWNMRGGSRGNNSEASGDAPKAPMMSEWAGDGATTQQRQPRAPRGGTGHWARRGPIHGLVGMAVSAAKNHKRGGDVERSPVA